MVKMKLPRMRNRVAIALWASVGIVGSLIAVFALLQLAGLGNRLPGWLPFTGYGKGGLVVAFALGVSIGCLALWGIYTKTIHANEPF